MRSVTAKLGELEYSWTYRGTLNTSSRPGKQISTRTTSGALQKGSFGLEASLRFLLAEDFVVEPAAMVAVAAAARALGEAAACAAARAMLSEADDAVE